MSEGRRWDKRRVWRVTEKTDRSFSNGQPVDSIETEKSRIVLRELEKGWWILAVSCSRHSMGERR